MLYAGSPNMFIVISQNKRNSKGEWPCFLDSRVAYFTPYTKENAMPYFTFFKEMAVVQREKKCV
jgi:hypothetical protein